jgi:glycosyltransferase involved in cell wall biosynthesis
MAYPEPCKHPCAPHPASGRRHEPDTTTTTPLPSSKLTVRPSGEQALRPDEQASRDIPVIVWADNDDQYVMINDHGAAVPLSGGPSCDSVACITGIAPQIISAAVNVAVVLRSGTMRGMVGELGVAPAELVPGEVQLSVVVPVYGCADCLAALHDRLTRSVAQITDRYELVFVDDRSQDSGWEVLGRPAQRDGHVRAFRLSRNFGQDAAITAGLSKAQGEWAVVMDCDLQEAPEDIPRMWTAAGEGYDVVRTIRRRWRHSPVRRRASRSYRRLTQETDVRSDYSNLSLISRQVIDAFLRLRDRDREYMIALDWLGFDATAIEIDHAERHAGQSGYTLRKLVRVALDGMFFPTTVLLRLVVLLGFIIALAGIVLAAFEVVDYIVEPDKSVAGYTSLAVLLLLLAGFIILSVGVVGLYVGRIFEQVKERPLFLIDAQTEGQDLSWPIVESLSQAAGPDSEAPEAPAANA